MRRRLKIRQRIAAHQIKGCVFSAASLRLCGGSGGGGWWCGTISVRGARARAGGFWGGEAAPGGGGRASIV